MLKAYWYRIHLSWVRRQQQLCVGGVTVVMQQEVLDHRSYYNYRTDLVFATTREPHMYFRAAGLGMLNQQSPFSFHDDRRYCSYLTVEYTVGAEATVNFSTSN